MNKEIRKELRELNARIKQNQRAADADCRPMHKRMMELKRQHKVIEREHRKLSRQSTRINTVALRRTGKIEKRIAILEGRLA